MMFWGNGMTGWGYALMTVSMVLFWGLLITGVVLLVRSMTVERPAPLPREEPPDPQRILAERYARGDIDESDYRERLKVLSCR